MSSNRTDSGNLYSQDLWDQGYASLGFAPVPHDDAVGIFLKSWVERVFLNSGTQRSCLEVGCFPGRYLALLGKSGFEVNGIDLTPNVDTTMVTWLKQQGCAPGEFFRQDFLAWKTEKRFDLVYSNGFIEHFEDWKPVLQKHAELVKPGGALMVCVPNFAGSVQRWLHAKLDEENLSRHYLPSMDPALWAPVLGAEYEVLWSGYFDHFRFWIGEQKRTVAQKIAFWSLRAMIPALSRIAPKNDARFAPYCGLVARRKAP